MGAYRSLVRGLVGMDNGLAVARHGARERRLHWLSTALALSVAALLVPSTGVARAEVPGLVSNGNFAAGNAPLGIAVDQSSGDVFAAGFLEFSNGNFVGLGRVEKFDASGKLLSPPSPSGEEANYGAAVNPTNGELYVDNVRADEIDTYDPNTGALVGSPFPVPAFGNPFEDFAQIASDSAGNVYVPNVPGDEVLEYPPTGGTPPGTPLKTFTGSGAHTLSGPTGVAVDSSGDVWVADDRNNRVEEFGPSGVFLSEFKSEGVRAIALYEHEGAVDVLAVVNNSADFCGSVEPPCAHLVEYGPAGVQLADVGAGDFGSVGSKFSPQPLSMVAVNQASGRVYVTDGSKYLVWVFQPPVAPVLSKELTAEVGTSEAKLGVLVNPGGAETTICRSNCRPG